MTRPWYGLVVAARDRVVVVGLFSRRDEPRAWPKLGQPAVVSSARSQRARRGRERDLARAVEDLARRESAADVTVIEVQLVVQVCAGAGYALWRETVERSWRRSATRSSPQKWSTAGWPEALGDEHVAVLLTPLPAGRVGLAGRNALPIADPVFSHGVPLPGAPRTDPVLELFASPAIARSDRREIDPGSSQPVRRLGGASRVRVLRRPPSAVFKRDASPCSNDVVGLHPSVPVERQPSDKAR